MDNFKNFIRNLICKTRLDSTYIERILSPENLKLFKEAFTHFSTNHRTNYEVYEQLGDITLNKFLVWYFHSRFPVLHSTLGVKIVARLRINYGSKQFLASLSEKLGFWEHSVVNAQDTIPQAKKMSILEDVFEAFVGVTEFIIDKEIYVGLGYISCYKMLANIFDKIPIDLMYENLFDAKTRLKEIFDINKDTLGHQKFEYDRSSGAVSIYRVFQDREIFIAKQTSPINKSDAEQRASEEALRILKSQGFDKQMPIEYTNLLSKIIKK